MEGVGLSVGISARVSLAFFLPSHAFSTHQFIAVRLHVEQHQFYYFGYKDKEA